MMGKLITVSVDSLDDRLYFPSAFYAYVYLQTQNSTFLINTAITAVLATIVLHFSSRISTEEYNKALQNPKTIYHFIILMSAFPLALSLVSIILIPALSNQTVFPTPRYVLYYETEVPNIKLIIWIAVVVFFASFVAKKVSQILKESDYRQTRLDEFSEDADLAVWRKLVNVLREYILTYLD